MGYIYLICDTIKETYKIGVTKNIINRIKNLQTANSTKLQFITSFKTDYPYRLETMLHNHFSNKCVLNEWYLLDNTDIKNFKQTCIRLNNIITSLLENSYFSQNLH